MRFLFTATLLILAIAALPRVSEAVTGNPTAGPAFGFDDWNTATVSSTATLSAAPSWLSMALANSAGPRGQSNSGAWSFANTAQWAFTYVSGGSLVNSNLGTTNYAAWVISNSGGYTYPDGTVVGSRNGVNGDLGGAQIVVTYMPGALDPGGSNSGLALIGTSNTGSVHFLQVVQETENFGNDATGLVTSSSTYYFLDNLASSSTPFYDLVGASGTAANNTLKWMGDRPYMTEDSSGYGNGASDSPQIVLSGSDLFDTFIAVDTGANGSTKNNVQLYGGLSWGYSYSNTDAPEPSTFALCGTAIALLIVGRKRFMRGPPRKRAQPSG